MPLVATQTVRCAFVGDYLGRPCVNTLDMFCGDGDGVSNPRQTNIDVMLETLMNAWVDHMLGGLAADYETRYISWVDLDTATGATGLKASTASHAFPLNGGQGGVPYSGNTALLMTKYAVSARGQRNGRWFLPALTESVMTGNTVDTSHIDDMNTLGADFVSAATETGTLATTHYYPVVVHTHTDNSTTPPTVTYVGQDRVQAMVASSTVASQRRRVRP